MQDDDDDGAEWFQAPFKDFGPAGEQDTYSASLSRVDAMSLRPGSQVFDRATDVLMYTAARVLRSGTGCDVRLVPSGMFSEWTAWANRKPDNVVDGPGRFYIASKTPPTSMQQFNLTGADYLLFAWHQGGHYSTALLCNTGTVYLR